MPRHALLPTSCSLIRSCCVRQVYSRSTGMKTTCTILGNRAASPGTPPKGRDATPFPSAENSIPRKVDTVARDTVHPRDRCGEDAYLPMASEKQHDGLDSPINEPINEPINVPINEPRTSHRLMTESQIPTVARMDAVRHRPGKSCCL